MQNDKSAMSFLLTAQHEYNANARIPKIAIKNVNYRFVVDDFIQRQVQACNPLHILLYAFKSYAQNVQRNIKIHGNNSGKIQSHSKIKFS